MPAKGPGGDGLEVARSSLRGALALPGPSLPSQELESDHLDVQALLRDGAGREAAASGPHPFPRPPCCFRAKVNPPVCPVCPPLPQLPSHPCPAAPPKNRSQLRMWGCPESSMSPVLPPLNPWPGLLSPAT